MCDPASRADYDRKRAEKKPRNAAIICLERRRCDLIYAIRKHQQSYQKPGRTAEPGT